MKAIKCLFQYFGFALVIFSSNFKLLSQPDWNIDATNFEYNMNVIGVGFIECNEINDDMDQIAAFVGDEIRGVNFFNVESNQRKFVYMFIYSNKFSGDTIHFKVYDASEDSIYELSSSIIFSENALLGSENNPIDFASSSQALQIEAVSNQVIRHSDVGDKITKLLVKNVAGLELNARIDWVQDEFGKDNHFFEIVGQDLYIKESILNVPMNELQIHIKVNVQGICEKTQIMHFNISDLTKLEDNVEQVSIEIYPNPVTDFFMVKSNILYDYAYLLNPLLDSMQKVELDRQIDATKLAPGLNYLVFRKGAKIWTKPFVIVSGK